MIKPREYHINWNASTGDYKLIELISIVFAAFMKEKGCSIDTFQMQMDLTAVHLNDRELQLVRMYQGANDLLVADCLTITKYINRYNGHLPFGIKLNWQMPTLH